MPLFKRDCIVRYVHCHSSQPT